MMRKFIDMINEATRPTKMKTATDLSSLQPGIHTGDIVPAAGSQNVSAVRPNSMSTASAADTSAAYGQRASAAMRGISPSQHANILRDLQAMGAGDEDDYATPGFDASTALAQAPLADPLRLGGGQALLAGHDRATNENLPQVMHQTLMAVDGEGADDSFNPKWHQIQNLPGYMQGAIRQVARQVFRVFTNQPIEQIQLMCDLLNPPRDVARMTEWIVEHGVKEDAAEYDFRQQMPAYAAAAGATVANMYRVGAFQFIVMQDNGGRYIYGFAAGDHQITNLRDPQAALPAR